MSGAQRRLVWVKGATSVDSFFYRFFSPRTLCFASMKQIEIPITTIAGQQISEEPASPSLTLETTMDSTSRLNPGLDPSMHAAPADEGVAVGARRRSSLYRSNTGRCSKRSLMEGHFEPVRLVGTEDMEMNAFDDVDVGDEAVDTSPASPRSSVPSFSDAKARETERLQANRSKLKLSARSLAVSSFNRYFERMTRLSWAVYSVEALFGLALMVACVVMLYSSPDGGLVERPYSFFVHVSADALDSRTELLRWGLIVAYALGLGFFVFRTLALSPFLISGFCRMTGVSLPERVKAEIIHFMNLKWYVSMVFFLLGLVLFGNHVFNEGTGDPRSWEFYCRRSLIAALVFFAILLAQKWIVQRISISFHRVHYADRVKESNLGLKVIMTLKRFALKTMPYSERPTGDPMDSLLSHITQIKQESLRSHNSSTSSLEETGSSIDDIKAQAAELALFIFAAFQTLREGTGREDGPGPGAGAGAGTDMSSITAADFLAAFRVDESEAAFALLDRDGNGDLTLEELIDSIVETFLQRNRLLKALEEGVLIISQLELLMSCIALILFLAICLPVFDMPTTSLAAFGTFFLGFGFIFGPLATKLLQSIVFIFVTHPYDIGDRVSVSSEYQGVTVQEISLLTTTFLQPNGKVVYIPNSTLGSNCIENIRRSLSQSEVVTLEVPATTPMDRLFELKERLRVFLEHESRDFHCSPQFFSFHLTSPKKLLLSIRLEHRSNFQDSDLQWKRRNKFNLFFIETTHSLGIMSCDE